MSDLDEVMVKLYPDGLPKTNCWKCGWPWPLPGEPWPALRPCSAGNCSEAYCSCCGTLLWSDGPADCPCQGGQFWWFWRPFAWVFSLLVRAVWWCVDKQVART